MSENNKLIMWAVWLHGAGIGFVGFVMGFVMILGRASTKVVAGYAVCSLVTGATMAEYLTDSKHEKLLTIGCLAAGWAGYFVLVGASKLLLSWANNPLPLLKYWSRRK